MSSATLLLLLLVAVGCVFAAPNINVVYLKQDNQINEAPVINPFIVGGTNAAIEDNPCIVSLLVTFPGVGTGLCGGTIIGGEWVVTAAHCFFNGGVFAASSVSVRSGSIYYNKGGYSHSATLVVTVGYNPSNFLHDIALVKVTPPFGVCSPTKPPITLPVEPRPKEGAIAVIAGWGTLTEGGALPPQLQAANVTIFNQDSCKKSYGSIILDSMFCAGVTGGGVDSCQGDSGGPITVSNVLVGIVSFGNGCARDGYPGVYTNVGTYREVIDSIKQIY